MAKHHWKGNNITYATIHWWNNKYFPKKGICKKCGQNKKTVWALLHGKKHKRGIKNYIELCQKCHINYDKTKEWIKRSKLALDKTYSHQNPIKEKACIYCKKMFLPQRKSRMYCSNSCSAKGCKKWLKLNQPQLAL